MYFLIWEVMATAANRAGSESCASILISDSDSIRDRIPTMTKRLSFSSRTLRRNLTRFEPFSRQTDGTVFMSIRQVWALSLSIRQASALRAGEQRFFTRIAAPRQSCNGPAPAGVFMTSRSQFNTCLDHRRCDPSFCKKSAHCRRRRGSKVNRLDFEQSYHENRETFVERLVAAGWRRDEAEDEWASIQELDPGDDD